MQEIKPCVLIVDDNPLNLDLLIEILMYDYDLVVAKNGLEALECIAKKTPELILLDIIMPVMNGYDVCKKLKSDVKTSNIPIIFITGLTDIEDKTKGFELGAVDYITKPFHSLEIKARVKAHLQISQMQLQLIIINEDLKKASYAANEANRAKTNFLSHMSHEIRSPMNTVLGFTELLINQITNPDQLKYLHLIRSNSNSLLLLINDILDLSKIEAGKISIKKVNIDLHDFFHEIENIFYKKIEDKKLQFILSIDKNMFHSIMIDEIRVRQILVNLISNAIKFTENGYIKLSATRRKNSENSKQYDLIISVEDTGIGIITDNIEKIFNRFEQQDNQNYEKYGGTGLGLAISRELAIMMDGEINVTSALGKGSVFELVFKKIEIDVLYYNPDIIKKTNEIKLSKVKFKPATLLITDDLEENRQMLTDFMKHLDFKFIYAENGREAIDMALKHKPDLIVMDVNMPVLDGYSAIKLMKSMDEVSSIPIIAFTASAMTEDIEKMEQAQFDGVLTKPFKPDQLSTELARFLPYTII